MKEILVIDAPNNCSECPCCHEGECGNKYKGYVGDYIGWDSGRPSWCPLKPIPEGHGDLIDRKALIENGLRKGFCDWYDEIKMADAIIEADKGETE